MSRARRALISVSDKTAVVALGRALRRNGVELVSSGGTHALLSGEGIAVRAVSDVTGAPEMLDGRVKTLHPSIFGGILARDTPEHRADLERFGIAPFDIVVVNLYPFERTVDAGADLDEAIETIDIGGPSLLRAAAKNHERVAVVVDPRDYDDLVARLEAGEIDALYRRSLAARAFAHTAAYDAAVSNYFERLGTAEAASQLPQRVSVQLGLAQSLRYGENPHQAAGYYAITGAAQSSALLSYQQLQGTELSYNNLVDADAAWLLASELPDCAVAIIKHTNPCGVAAVLDCPAEAFRRALAGDPVSAFGGIVAVNRPVTLEMAEELRKLFLELVIAPSFEAGAIAALKKKKKLRLLAMGDQQPSVHALGRIGWASALGGILLQEQDGAVESVEAGTVATVRKPSALELAELQFAWIVCKHVKSNAIVFTAQRQLRGVGAGQMSRVDAVKLAKARAILPLEGSVAASDAFFPFRDGLDEVAAAGAVAVVQPGGSLRDAEVVAAADEHEIAMVFTGHRHFRH